jgi:hypothetical protein
MLPPKAPTRPGQKKPRTNRRFTHRRSAQAAADKPNTGMRLDWVTVDWRLFNFKGADVISLSQGVSLHKRPLAFLGWTPSGGHTVRRLAPSERV